MTPERYQRVVELFELACELDKNSRRIFLEEKCAGDPDLRREVEEMLASDESGGKFLESSPADLAAGVLALQHEENDQKTTADSELIGQCIGPYRINALIGRGGMGAVYRAVREDEFRMVVAIKLLKRGTDTDAALSRFRTERKILARLQHANIARLLDGGATDSGLPYFVMEHVEGKPLLEYSAPLSIRERLQLFRGICAAVQYLHQNLVVHRDIKPGNILVTADGIPKLLDFGIAKLLKPELEDKITATLAGVRMFSPAYASPEQVRGELITTATDVYSLGVVLYELLTGQLPYKATSSSIGEVEQAICHQEPEAPSALEKRLHKALAGDLDNILLMALRKDPDRRYSSVEQFSEDIRRHLDGLPVIARKETFTYVMGKFLRRHRASAAVAAAVLAIALGAGGAVAWQAGIASRESARAETRFNEVRKLAKSVMEEIHDGIVKVNGSLEVRKLVITRALEYLDSLAAESSAPADLKLELAQGYTRVGNIQGLYTTANLGDSAGALASYDKSLGLLGSLNQDWPRVRLAQVNALVNKGYVLYYLRKLDEAETYIRKAVVTAEQLPAIDELNTNFQRALEQALTALAVLQSARGDPAHIETRRRILRMSEAMLAANPESRNQQRNVAIAHRYLASAVGRRDQQERLRHVRLALAFDAKRAALAPEDAEARLDLSYNWSELADLWSLLDRREQALNCLKEVLAIRQSLADKDPRNWQLEGRLIYAHQRMGGTLFALNRPQLALPHFQEAARRAEAHSRATPGDVSSRSWWAAALLGAARVEMSTGSRGCPKVRQAEAILQKLSLERKDNRDDQVAKRELAPLLQRCGGGPGSTE